MAAKKRSNKSSTAGAYPVSQIDRDYQAEDDVRTLARAEEIKADKKRFAAAQTCAKRKIEEMENIFGEDDESDDKK